MQTADLIVGKRGEFHMYGEMYLDLPLEKQREIDVLLQTLRREIEIRRPFAEKTA